MEEFEGLVPEQVVEQEELRKTEALRAASSREQAIERGRLLGEDEARLRGETGREAEQRVRRARSYAAWEYDGKPVGEGERYQEEFGGGVLGTYAGVRRGGSDFKNGKKGG